jgi:RNA polymerase sigma-70 factor (sigma-E family)
MRPRSEDDEFIAFVASRSGRLVAQAELLCGDHEQARDIVQNALARAYARWHRIEHDDPYGYVSRCIVNAVTDHWRLPYRRRERAHADLPEAPQPETGLSFEDRDELMTALAALTPRERTVIVLRHLDDRSEATVAEMLGVTTGTVKTLSHRGLKKLRRQLSGALDGRAN